MYSTYIYIHCTYMIYEYIPDKSQDRASLLTSSFHLLPSISAYATKTLAASLDFAVEQGTLQKSSATSNMQAHFVSIISIHLDGNTFTLQYMLHVGYHTKLDS